MYWCKRNGMFAIGIGALWLASCRPEVKETNGIQYFDIKKYFTDEAKKLDSLHPLIWKTIIYNGQPEKKQVRIANWKRELGLFLESDINKPSWRDSYKVSVKNDSMLFTAIGTALRTRKILVVSNFGKVKTIQITNFTKNLLYQTGDHLTYYPDSVYEIEKQQSVRILGANNYKITGMLK